MVPRLAQLADLSSQAVCVLACMLEYVLPLCPGQALANVHGLLSIGLWDMVEN